MSTTRSVLEEKTESKEEKLPSLEKSREVKEEKILAPARFSLFKVKGVEHPFIFRTRTTSLPRIQAVYIRAFNEVFTEVKLIDEQEFHSLLNNLENLLKTNPDAVIYLEVETSPSFTFSDCLEELTTWKKDSLIADQLIKQRDWDLDLPEERKKFMQECQDQGIATVYLGGVYGRACVSVSACEMADILVLKQLPDVPLIFDM